MTQYRYNKALDRLGLDNNMQGHIYYKLMNIKYYHKEFDAFVRKCCEEAALDEWQALYRFLTDDTINDKFIYIEYGIPDKRLFAWKRKVYVRIAKYIKGEADA